MTDLKVTYQGNSQQVREAIDKVIDILVAGAPDPQGIGDQVYLAMAASMLDSVKKNYLEKADGGAGDYGDPWPPLSPETIARRQITKGDLRDKSINNFQKLKNKLKKFWLGRLKLSLPGEAAEKRAEHLARGEASRRLGKSLLSLLGSRDVKMLIDTERLLNSISVGRLDEGKYTPPEGPGGEDQLIDFGDGKVVIQTDVEYAEGHNKGLPLRKPPLPQREFMPENPPQKWEDASAEAGADALAEAIVKLLK